MTVLDGGTVLCRLVREGCPDVMTFEQRAEGREQRAMCISAGRASKSRAPAKPRLPGRSRLSGSRNGKEGWVSEVGQQRVGDEAQDSRGSDHEGACRPL